MRLTARCAPHATSRVIYPYISGRSFSSPSVSAGETALFPSGDRSKNEEALWAVNAELEIWEPAVEDEEIVIGGRLSRENEYFPFQSEHEAQAVLRVVATAEILTKRSWAAWRRMINDPESEYESIDRAPTPERRRLGDISGNSLWLPSNEHTTKVKGKERTIIESLDLSGDAAAPGLPTPPSSGNETTPPAMRIRINTMQDFYTVLDKLERTSGMSARFLEAYAERLRDEVCMDCWFKHNVLDDDQLEDPMMLSRRPVWTKGGAVAAVFAR